MLKVIYVHFLSIWRSSSSTVGDRSERWFGADFTHGKRTIPVDVQMESALPCGLSSPWEDLPMEVVHIYNREEGRHEEEVESLWIFL